MSLLKAEEWKEGEDEGGESDSYSWAKQRKENCCL